MKTTENYKLNQWDMTDRIQMEDFNKDNQNIENALTAHDTALAEQAAATGAVSSAIDTLQQNLSLISLGNWTVGSESSSYTISLNATAKSCKKLYLLFDVKTKTSDDINCLFNGDSSKSIRICYNCDGFGSGTAEIFNGGSYLVLRSDFFSLSGTTTRVYTCSGTAASFSLSQLNSLVFSCATTSQRLLANSKFYLYGLR